MKKIIFLSVVLALVFSMSPLATAATKPLKIAFFVSDLSNVSIKHSLLKQRNMLNKSTTLKFLLLMVNQTEQL